MPNVTTRQDTEPHDAGQTAARLDADPFVAASPEHRHFWDAAEKGDLVLKVCGSCARAHWFPRMVCPFCRSLDLHWQPSPGEGTVFSYSVMRKVEVPYVLAYVELDEHVLLVTNIIDCDVDAVRIGQRVRVVFRATQEGRLAPFFVLADPTDLNHSRQEMNP